jgi:hypothetical protein
LGSGKWKYREKEIIHWPALRAHFFFYTNIPWLDHPKDAAETDRLIDMVLQRDEAGIDPEV